MERLEVLRKGQLEGQQYEMHGSECCVSRVPGRHSDGTSNPIHTLIYPLKQSSVKARFSGAISGASSPGSCPAWGSSLP